MPESNSHLGNDVAKHTKVFERMMAGDPQMSFKSNIGEEVLDHKSTTQGAGGAGSHAEKVKKISSHIQAAEDIFGVKRTDEGYVKVSAVVEDDLYEDDDSREDALLSVESKLDSILGGMTGIRPKAVKNSGVTMSEARATNLLKISAGIGKNPEFEKKIDGWSVGSAVVALMRGTDGNAYEVVVRPARLGEFKKLFKKYLTKKKG